MHKLSPRQWTLLGLLTIVWGLNWPIMKIGVTGYPPLTFRMLCLWPGTVVLGLVLLVMRVPFRIGRAQWREVLVLAVFNMVFWNGLIILAVQSLSSGRAAILGYTMPMFSAVMGGLFFGERLVARAWAGVGAAALGVLLLLWHEFTHLSGRPLGVLLALVAAATWALGTQLLRRTRMTLPTLTLSFWMMAFTALVITAMAWLLESERWTMPSRNTWAAVAYNALLVLGLGQAAWFALARSLPPVASSLSVMLIPVVGVFSGALWLGEVLHWQDLAAVVLMVVSIAAVLWPRRQSTAAGQDLP